MTVAGTELRSWHGDPAIKEKYQARMRAHIEADELIRGQGWEEGKGCAVGCTFDAYDHTRGPVEIGMPEWLMRLIDVIFEGVSEERSILWPEQFLEAVPVGIDLEPVRWKLAIARHKRQLEVLTTNQEPYARQVEGALHMTIAYFEMLLSGEPESAAESAESAAESARSAHYEWEADTLLQILRDSAPIAVPARG